MHESLIVVGFLFFFPPQTAKCIFLFCDCLGSVSVIFGENFLCSNIYGLEICSHTLLLHVTSNMYANRSYRFFWLLITWLTANHWWGGKAFHPMPLPIPKPGLFLFVQYEKSDLKPYCLYRQVVYTIAHYFHI